MANAAGGDGAPESETLKPRDNAPEVKQVTDKAERKVIPDADKQKRRNVYRPSHRAMFIGMAVVVAILALNAVVLAFLLKNDSAAHKALDEKGVSISPGTLSKLGVNDAQIGNSNETLIVDPNAQFNSNLQVAGNVNVSGQFHLNSTFSADNASLTQLQAGTTSVNALTINGNATADNLSLTGELNVNGAAVFQNTVKIGQILTVDNSAAVANNLSVGGEITANTIAASNLILTGTFVFGSHLQTSGATPGVGPGTALGSYGTVSINGDDATGTVAINIGVNAHSGTLAYVSFHSQYSATPRVVITAIGADAGFYLGYVNTSGFSIDDSSALGAGGYDIDYIVEQ